MTSRILVCSDAGAAGRELLTRRDVHLEWALTPEEAVGSVQRRLPHVVLAREEFLQTFLRHVRIPNIPVIVLLESDGYQRRDLYFGLGVTALVNADRRDRILELLAELAGLRMDLYPRIPYAEVVDVRVEGTHAFLEAAELSTSGVQIRDFPAVPLGTVCEVTFAMMEPPYTFEAMVTRHVSDTYGSVTGVSFTTLTEDERQLLVDTIDRVRRLSDPLPDPVGLTTDLSGSTFTMDLFTAMQGEADNVVYHELLRNLMRLGADSVRAPRWLRRVRRHLTEVEQRWLLTGTGPEYAGAALDMRIDLARARAHSVAHGPSAKEVELCLDFCRAMAIDAIESEAKDISQVPEIRAGLLREVYGSMITPKAERPTPPSSRRSSELMN
ncbi:MAG: PilZ domain-containing protein [Myxococcota bacterium]